MRKATTIAGVAVLFAAVVILATAPPAAASNRYFAVGAYEFSLPLGPYCGGATTYPANQPLIIAHGWYDTDFIADPLKGAFMAPTTSFELQIDSVTQPSAAFMRYVPAVDTMYKWYVSEYDHGLTGTHEFLGLWTLDGALVGGTPHQAVFFASCEVTITFA